MTISPGANFDDPRFRNDGRTPAQRLEAGDYYIADDELATSTKRAVRLLSLYEQAHPTDPDIAAYLLAQVLGQVGEDVDIRPPLRVDYGYNISIGDGSWVNYGLTGSTSPRSSSAPMSSSAPTARSTRLSTRPSLGLVERNGSRQPRSPSRTTCGWAAPSSCARA